MPALRRTPYWGLVLLLVLALAHVAGAQGAGPNVRVTLRNGTVVNGTLVEETDAYVRVRVGYGVVDYPRADISNIERLGGPTTPQTPQNPQTPQPPQTSQPSGPTVTYIVIRMRDGSIVRGRSARDSGAYLELESDHGTVQIDKSQIEARWEEQVASGEAPAPWVYRDYDFRFAYARPNDDWRFVTPFVPGARLQMARTSHPGFFVVTVEGVIPGAEGIASRDTLAQIEDRVEEETRARFQRLTRFETRMSDLFGAPVYLLDYTGQYRIVDQVTFRFQEIRFFQGSCQYVLRAYAPDAEFESLLPEIPALLSGFFFTGPVAVDGGEYIDYNLGFRFSLPDPSWQIYEPIGQPRVLEILFPDPDRSLIVTTEASTLSPEQFAQADEERLRGTSQFFQLQGERTTQTMREASVVDLTYQDFSGGTRLLYFHARYFQGGAGIVRLLGSYPANATNRADLQRSMDEIFHSFDILRPGDAQAFVQSGQAATQQLAAGEQSMTGNAPNYAAAITAFTNALTAFPNFGRAYLLRGKARAASGDYRGAIQDLEQAAGRTEIPGIPDLILDVKVAYGHSLVDTDNPATLDYERGTRILADASRQRPDDRRLKEDLEEAYVNWVQSFLPRGGTPNYREATQHLEEGFEALEGYDARNLVRVAERQVWSPQIEALIEASDFRRAQRLLRDARQMIPTSSVLDRLEERINRGLQGGR